MMLFLFCFIKGIVYPMILISTKRLGVVGGEKNGVDF